MKEYVPTKEDVEELNKAAEKVTEEELKKFPMGKEVEATTYYKKLSVFNSPEIVDQGLSGITKKGMRLLKRINEVCGYNDKQPEYLE